MFKTHFPLSFPSFWGAAAVSDSRAWIDQMMEEVRCPWRKSEGLPETSQSISWATAGCHLLQALLDASLWPRPSLSVASLCLAQCCRPCLGSLPTSLSVNPPHPSALSQKHHLLWTVFPFHPTPPPTQVLFLHEPTTSWANLHCNDHPRSNSSWYLLALYYVSGTVLPIYRC